MTVSLTDLPLLSSGERPPQSHHVVWIAPAFRAAHLSAIRWLNEHTADGFSFFAVKVRVVQIGDSPFAPIFEVVEEPDEWVRKLKTDLPKGDIKVARSQYFDRLTMLCPKIEFVRRNRHLLVPIDPDAGLKIALEMSRGRAMIFVLSDTATEFGDLTEEIEALSPGIESALSKINETKWGGALFKSIGCDLDDDQNWDQTLAWHKEKLEAYLKCFTRKDGAV